MVLELLAPICKREKSGIHSHGFFPPKASFPALDGGVDRLYQSFPSLVRISLSLTDVGILLVPPGSITEVGWRCPRVGLMHPRLISSSLPPRHLFDLPE